MLDDRLARLARQIVRARVLFDLWWLCAGTDTRQPYEAAFHRYSEMFKFTEHGLLIAAVVQCSIPFDRTKGTLSLLRAINEVAAQGSIGAAEKAVLIGRINALDSSVAGIRALRHNAFAHLSRAIGYNESFTKAGLRPNDIRAVIDEAMAIINALLLARGLDTVEPNPFPAQDGLALLQDLARLDRDEG